MDLFRVAVVQAGSVPFDRERSTTKVLDLTGQAIRSGAQLIVFPEAFISGYPTWRQNGGCHLLGKLHAAGPDYSDEKILTADLDPGEIAEGKFDLDATGHYSRPDVFRLEVNEKAGF